ncbi:protein transport protein sec31, putative [Leishmania tarentolae]|uniref:Protein transport protein sec31, putative n=1 Tax=Leishmania tarentolae TaxID=5689 RepID=A0A640KAJ8_LEITA|nr:protein transport protein sec31, putative [Leishmania tarentolae]
MRLKNTALCCAFAWSPAVLGNPPLLATASYSGAMDENFSSDAFLEIRLVDVKVTDDTELPVVGRVRLQDRAHRVDWSPYAGPQGIIGVSCGNGCVYIFSAAEVLAAGPNGGGEEVSDQPRGLLWIVREHAGLAVRGFHFNPSKPHFFATGADDGVWRVWTLQDGATGGVCAPTKVSVISNVPNSGAIVHLQWHPKYAHIFATATVNGVINVWNLKMATRVTALNVSKASHGAQITAIAWNPTAATQLVVGLDDGNPVLQVWDLRTGVVPLREMSGHTGGITGLAWSEQESSMVASCGADGRTMWWDPNTGKKLGELQPVGQYLVDVQWCPVLPAVIATSSFAPLLCVSTAQDVSSSGGDTLSAVPKWLQKPCGASVNMSLAVASLAPGTEHDIVVSSVNGVPMSPNMTEEQQLFERLAQFPRGSPERTQWLRDTHHELLAAFSSAQNSRQPILDFLNEGAAPKKGGSGAGSGRAGEDDDDPFTAISHENQKSYEDRTSELIVSGKIEEAVDLCMDEHCFDDAFAIAFLSGGEMVRKVHQRYIAHVAAVNPQKRHVLYAGAIASGDYRPLIQANVPWKEVLSAIVAFVVGDGFANACNLLGDALRDQKNYEGAYHCYVCARNVDAVVDLWRLENRPSREVVQDTILLEETTQRAASGEYLAHCMCDYGMKLLTDGHPKDAVQYLQRAACLGDHTATVLVDRMKYLFNLAHPENSAPYVPAPVSDAQSPACQAFLAAAEERRMRDLQEQEQKQAQAQPQTHAVAPQQHHQQGQPPMPSQGPPQLPAMPPQNQCYVNPMAMPGQPQPPQSGYPPAAGYMPPMGAPAAASQPPQQPQHPPSLFPHKSVAGGLPPPPGGSAPLRPPLMPGAGAAPPPPSHGPSVYGNATPVSNGMSGAPVVAPPISPHSQSGGGAPMGMSASDNRSLSPSALPTGLTNPLAASPNGAIGQPKPRLMPHPVSSYSSMRTPITGTTPAATAPPPPGPPSSSAMPSRAPSQPGSLYSVTAPPTQPLVTPPPATPPPVTQPSPYQAAPAQPPQRLDPVYGGGASSMLKPTPPPPGPPRPAMVSTSPPHPQSSPARAQYPGALLASVNSAQFKSPLQGQLVQRLQQIIPMIAEPRRRAAVEQAAVELIHQLQQGMLPEELVQMLMHFCANAGTPNAAQAWAQLSQRYPGAIQGFANLCYL